METFLKEVMTDQDRDNLATFWAQHGAPLTEKIVEQEVHELMPLVKRNLDGGPDFWTDFGTVGWLLQRRW